MDFKSLQYIRVDLADNIAELGVNRPKALNALNSKVLAEMEGALGALRDIDSLACLIISGDDRAFVAGADIAEMAAFDEAQAKTFSQLGHRIYGLIADFPVPVLAAVGGYALGGGCELALACDIIYASERAKFGQPEVKLGLMPGFGGTVRLPRRIGLSAASEWIYTGEMYNAQQAQALGLVREVLAPDMLLDRVREVAKIIASRAPLAVRAAKRSIKDGLATDNRTACTIEQDQFAPLFATEDMREGTSAFVEKRDAQFKGK